MALGVDQLIDFLDAYFGYRSRTEEYLATEEKTRLLKPVYDVDSHAVVLTVETVERGDKPIRAVAHKLPVTKMEGGANETIQYVERELAKMRTKLISEIEPDGTGD